jgi:Bromodomain
LFPEYYEFIKNPVDLSTIKEQLGKYDTVEECLGDIRQIWENCRLFNAEGSDISATADLLQTELEELVEVST